MSKKNSAVARRAWNILRLTLLWARKGHLRRRLMMEHLRVVPKFLKSIYGNGRGDRIQYFNERELSFDKTPVIHIKMHRPNSMRFLIPIPCINPPVDFDYDFAGDDSDGEDECGSARKSFLTNGKEDGEYICEYEEQGGNNDEEGIDLRAEEFIAKFYEQMKLQRQISYLQYTDAYTNRGSA